MGAILFARKGASFGTSASCVITLQSIITHHSGRYRERVIHDQCQAAFAFSYIMKNIRVYQCKTGLHLPSTRTQALQQAQVLPCSRNLYLWPSASPRVTHFSASGAAQRTRVQKSGVHTIASAELMLNANRVKARRERIVWFVIVLQ